MRDYIVYFDPYNPANTEIFHLQRHVESHSVLPSAIASPEEKIVQALAIGQRVMEVASGPDFGEVFNIVSHSNMGELPHVVVNFDFPKTKPLKPKPRKGLDWLKSKPNGYRFVAEGRRYVTIDNGIFEFQTKTLISWKRLRKKWSHFLEHLSEETCPTWEPKE